MVLHQVERPCVVSSCLKSGEPTQSLLQSLQCVAIDKDVDKSSFNITFNLLILLTCISCTITVEDTYLHFPHKSVILLTVLQPHCVRHSILLSLWKNKHWIREDQFLGTTHKTRTLCWHHSPVKIYIQFENMTEKELKSMDRYILWLGFFHKECPFHSTKFRGKSI